MNDATVKFIRRKLFRSRAFQAGTAILTAAAVLAGISGSFYAIGNIAPETPYVSYIYQLEGQPVEIPAPYQPVAALTGTDLGLTPFSGLSDIYYDPDGKRYYLCDSGNNRIVFLSDDLKLEGELVTFVNHTIRENLSAPGSCVVKNNRLYIADTGSGRIIAIRLEDIRPMDEDTTILRSPKAEAVYEKPDIDILGQDYTYQPTKIEVDFAGRIYVIAAGINQGLIQLDENGGFMGFLGAPRVVPKAADVLWRKFYTDEQKKRIFKFVPTEYNSVKLDSSGFFYVSSQTVSIPPISRLNSQGENILKRRTVVTANGSIYPDGDGSYADHAGTVVKNYFLDVEPLENGMYMGLDSNSGKIFAYDRDGMLLYAFGGIGPQTGTFYSPSAMSLSGSRILVTDYAKGTLTVFEQTQFGAVIEKAVESHRIGDYEASRIYWSEILSICSNYEAADIGLARIEIQEKKYAEALARLKPIGERYYYSLAYRETRSLFMKKNFTWIFLGLLLVLGALLVLPGKIRNSGFYRKATAHPFYQEIHYAKHVIFHPFDGFWDLKREKKGSVRAAAVFYGLFAVLYAVRAQFSGYIVTGVRPEEVNILYEVSLILIPLVLFIVSNWCFTTLMDGEGSMKDIFIAAGYALRPYILLSVPLLLLSHFLVGEEIAFYTILNTVAIGWTLALLVLGMMVTHDYSFAKNLLATVLTIVGILLMIFIGLLLVHIIQDVIGFFSDIYNEISFRTY